MITSVFNRRIGPSAYAAGNIRNQRVNFGMDDVAPCYVCAKNYSLVMHPIRRPQTKCERCGVTGLSCVGHVQQPKPCVLVAPASGAGEPISICYFCTDQRATRRPTCLAMVAATWGPRGAAVDSSEQPRGSDLVFGPRSSSAISGATLIQRDFEPSAWMKSVLASRVICVSVSVPFRKLWSN